MTTIPRPFPERITLVRPNIEDIPRDPVVPGFRIYPAIESDFEGIAALLNAAFPTRGWCADSVRRSIIAPAYAFVTFVAVDPSDRVVGTASSRKRFGMGEVAWVTAAASERRKGLSSALVWRVLGNLKRSGFKEACTVLVPPTEESVAFWRSLAFTEYREDLL